MKRILAKLFFGLVITTFILTLSSCFSLDDYDSDITSIVSIDYDNTIHLTADEQYQLDWYYSTTSTRLNQVSQTGKYSLFMIESSDPSICTVSSNGVLTALKGGSVMVTITPKRGTGYAWYDVYISGPTYTVESIVLNTTTKTLSPECSDSIYFRVNPYYAPNTEVTCKSSDESIVTASVSGNYLYLASGTELGTATITLTSVDNPSVTATCTVTVTDGYTPQYKVTSLTMSNEYLFLDIGETATLSVTQTPSTARDDVTWSSSNKAVATVSGGLVKAIKSGTTVITATSRDNPDVSTTCEVTVSNNQYIQVTGLSFSPSSVSIERGDSTTVSVTVTPSNAKPKLTWTSSSSYFTFAPNENDPTKCTVTGISDGSGYLNVKLDNDSSIYASVQIVVKKPAARSADQFFWGTWIRMDNGNKIIIEDKQLVSGYYTYDITRDSTSEKLVIDGTIGSGISEFTKKTQNVIEAKEGNAVIPFYRQGGTQLDYTLKVVGNADLVSRAASGLGGLAVKGTSKKFKSFESDGETQADGTVSLKAPVQGDIQTVSITLPASGNEESRSIVVDNLKIENSGDYMGTVAIAGKDDYSLKITGTIDDSEKTNGYLYAGHTYTMHLEIKNTSEVVAEYSVLSITPNEGDTFITLSSNETDMPNLGAFSVPTINPGQKEERDIQITIGDFSDAAYKDTKINIEIINDTGWVDFVPIRIFSGETKITFNAGPARNSNASLNGFLIFPDGNSQFFRVPQDDFKTISVPKFKPTDTYKLVFCGATVEGNLSNSTELFYTVSLSNTKKELHDAATISATALRNIQTFGEKNETEDATFAIEEDFEAYLGQGDTDFYSLKIPN